MTIQVTTHNSEIVEFIVNRKTIIIDAQDWPLIKDKPWQLDSWKRVYYKLKRKGFRTRYFLLHRFIDNTPSGIEIDHINNNCHDNRRINLRRCTRTQNEWNKPQLKGRFKGVCFEKRRNKWKAAIRHYGSYIHIGYFICEVEAAKAYNKKAKELRGEFAWLNPIED